MRRALLAALALALAAPLAARADCPPMPDTGDARAVLHTQLLAARSESEARALADRLWRIWTTAPDRVAQDLLDRGMARREAYDFAGAEALFDELITYCPGFTEAFNQRAFVRFLRENWDGALADLDHVLDENPYHFGALSGKALTLMQQGRTGLAQDALRRAVKINPYLKERGLLIEPRDSDL